MYENIRLTSATFKTKKTKQDFIVMATERNILLFWQKEQHGVVTVILLHGNKFIFRMTHLQAYLLHSPEPGSVWAGWTRFTPLSDLTSGVNAAFSATTRFVNKVCYQNGNKCVSVISTTAKHKHPFVSSITHKQQKEKWNIKTRFPAVAAGRCSGECTWTLSVSCHQWFIRGSQNDSVSEVSPYIEDLWSTL